MDEKRNYKVEVEKIGNFLYWKSENGDLYRAKFNAISDIDGKPGGSRWEAPAYLANDCLQMYRNIEAK